MPYTSNTDLPDTVRSMPAHAQDIYRAAFNGAWEEYGAHEETAHRVAWSAVKLEYERRGNRWLERGIGRTDTDTIEE